MPLALLADNGTQLPVFWGYVLPFGVPSVVSAMLDNSRMAVVLDLDETLLVRAASAHVRACVYVCGGTRCARGWEEACTSLSARALTGTLAPRAPAGGQLAELAGQQGGRSAAEPVRPGCGPAWPVLHASSPPCAACNGLGQRVPFRTRVFRCLHTRGVRRKAKQSELQELLASGAAPESEEAVRAAPVAACACQCAHTHMHTQLSRQQPHTLRRTLAHRAGTPQCGSPSIKTRMAV
jgi:hypothetical protein